MNKVLTILLMGSLGLLVSICITILTNFAFASPAPYKIAVIDTGFAPLPYDQTATKLCKDGHFDYSSGRAEVGYDLIGHGMFVTSLIDQAAQTDNVCYMIYKVFGGQANIDSVAKALIRAKRNGAQAINMSITLQSYNHKLFRVLKHVTSSNIKVFAAAGNRSVNLNKFCNTYPTCFNNIKKNLFVVGSVDRRNRKELYSNYGARVAVYEWGTIQSARGTSFAAPRALGNYVRSLKLDR